MVSTGNVIGITVTEWLGDELAHAGRKAAVIFGGEDEGGKVAGRLGLLSNIKRGAGCFNKRAIILISSPSIIRPSV
jgi:hypothetical protein